jgi:adenosylcobyric acid synthase
MKANVLMVQGTSSSVGKSVLAAALCRLYARRGLRVAPFKAQNMSNNAAVCADGSEIGRAQAVQAAAAGIEPDADMNPILLKPEGQARSQVVVRGRPWLTLSARAFYERKAELWPIVTASLDRLRDQYDLVIAEGAGSPVELNLRQLDIVNMALARHAGARVLLVGDIDRGGIFAQLLGTLHLFAPEERALVGGLIVNKFRGDPALFADGIGILEERSGLPVLGVVPFLECLNLPEEDAVALEENGQWSVTSGQSDARIHHSSEVLDLAIIRLPHIANFDDFDPLVTEPGVRLRYVASAKSLGRPHAIIVAGTKSTVADLAWLHREGVAEAIRQRAAAGTAVVGICGGYQILGEQVSDPEQIESPIQQVAGLGLLPVETMFTPTKATAQVRARILGGPGWLAGLEGHQLSGYEIHMGRTRSPSAWLNIFDRNGVTQEREGEQRDGAVTADARIWGCYLHGLFANEPFRRAWLDSVRRGCRIGFQSCQNARQDRNPIPLSEALDRLADAVAACVDLDRLDTIIEVEHARQSR